MTEIRTAIPGEVDAYLDALVRKGIFATKAELVRAAIVSYVNATGTMFKGFDSENIFAPDGRLYQVEYARESSARGGTVVGITCEDGILLAAEAPPKSKLAPEYRKVQFAGDRLALAPSGLVADGLLLADELRAAAPKTTEEALRILRATFHRYTVDRTQRPLGVSTLLGSALDKRPRLFHVDPSGAVVERYAAAIGRNAPAALELLESRYRKLRLSEAEKLVPELLGREVAAEIVRFP